MTPDEYHDEPEYVDDLDSLIRYLEKEKDRLRKLIEDACEEWEFAQAHEFAKAYRHVISRLDVLKGFKDPNYRERAQLYQWLISLEENLEKYADNPVTTNRLKNTIQQINEKLEKLESIKSHRLDTQYIDDAIFLLIEGKILNFMLHLNKEEKIALDFRYNDKTLIVKLVYGKSSLWPKMKKKLRKVGFSKLSEERAFVYQFDLSTFKNALKIKQFLAVTIFESFGLEWLDSPSELAINHVPGGERLSFEHESE